MGGIIWLASYPKSGNTWLRSFLTNYWYNDDEPVHINNLSGGPIASSQDLFNSALGLDATDLTRDEVEHYRPLTYDWLVEQNDEPFYLKIHDAFTRNAEGCPIVSMAATRSVIYIIRNPLDVAVSLAHFMGWPIKRAVRQMGNEHFALASDIVRGAQLTQRLLTWSGHVRSWIDKSDLRVHVVRYEDMQRAPLEVFSEVARFAELEPDPARIEKAVRFSSFETLQAQEQEHGFREKPMSAQSFFRKGQTGGWREQLTPEQVEKILADHGEMMRRFDYLTSDGEIVF
jgi:hypothetical protein